MNTLLAIFVPLILHSSSSGGYHGSGSDAFDAFDALMGISMFVGGAFLTVAIIREMDRDMSWPQKDKERNRIDIAIWIAACICPLTWVILFGAGLYHLAKRHDSP